MADGGDDEISDEEERIKEINREKKRRYWHRVKQDPERRAELLKRGREWKAKKRIEDPEWADMQNKKCRWSANNRYGGYKRDAENRGLNWDLTIEDCEVLFIENCHYCGRSPEETDSLMGIDRKDNARGYFPGNALPCCWMCNRAKKTDTYEVFGAWLDCVASFRNAKYQG